MVLTPAVAAAVRTARAEQPVPYLLVCAFIANAASFVLPISNPANLVIYGNHMPPLLQWLPRYLLPSIVSIVATYLALWWTQRRLLSQTIAKNVPVPALSGCGKTAAAGILATAALLLVVSAMDIRLGLPTLHRRPSPPPPSCSFSRPAQTMERTEGYFLGCVAFGRRPVRSGRGIKSEGVHRCIIKRCFIERLKTSAVGAAWAAGAAVAVASNLANNLPVGLIAGGAVQSDHTADQVTRAILIGVDLGPNPSVTGLFATILWLAALRREELSSALAHFLKIGAVVMPPALVLSIAAALLTG